MKTTRILAHYNLSQLPRTPVKTILFLVLTAVVSTFLCISLNLRQTVQDNHQILTEEFDVVAIPAFMGSVDKQGRLTESTASGVYQGYIETYAEDFDLSVIENAAGVKDILVHKQFGAYMKSETDMVPGNALTRNNHDIAIFTYDGTEPLVVDPWNTEKIDMTVLWSARGFHKITESPKGMSILNSVDTYTLKYRWQKPIEELSLEDMWPVDEFRIRTGAFVLQPGQTYIASVNWYFAISERENIYVKGSDLLKWAEICVDEGHSKQEIGYEAGGFYAVQDPTAYHVTFPCILPYYEGFWETEAGSYYQDAAEICKINGSTLTVVSTDDLSMYQPFYEGNVYISQGRTFMEEDYANGNKVCIISKVLAEQNGWEIGHKLEMSFFEALYGYNVRSADTNSYYEPLTEYYDETTETYYLEMNDLFFDKGEYEIIGFYDGNITKSEFSMDIQYTRDEGIDRRNIFVPQTSVDNQPDVPLSKYNTTIVLDDELYIYFMSDMEASGLLEQQKGKYQLRFNIYDQGYGAIKQSLRQLDVVSRMILYVAAAVAVVVVVLLAILTVLQNRRQIATLRSLGVRKRQIPGAVLSGILLICLLGAVLGGAAGYAASEKVAAYILETAQQDMADTTFTATLAKDDADRAAEYAIAIQSHPISAVLTTVLVLVSLTLLSCGLALLEARKSPMLTLGAKE